MAIVNITYKTSIGIIDIDLLNNLLRLYKELFEDADLSFFKDRIYKEQDVFITYAILNNEIIGFKIGYPKNHDVFYSWVGGVKNGFRNKGVATHLAMLQEQYAKESGFTILKTKSMNRFKPMMILNLKNGYNISNVYTNDKGQTKIVFEKSLK